MKYGLIPNKVFDKNEQTPIFEESFGWSSGPTALWLATYGKGHDNDPNIHTRI